MLDLKEMNSQKEFSVVQCFTIQNRGVVVDLNSNTDLSVGKPYNVKVSTPEGKIYNTEAYKEWQLHREPETIEIECFILMNLSSNEVPVGSVVTFI